MRAHKLCEPSQAQVLRRGALRTGDHTRPKEALRCPTLWPAAGRPPLSEAGLNLPTTDAVLRRGRSSSALGGARWLLTRRGQVGCVLYQACSVQYVASLAPGRGTQRRGGCAGERDQRAGAPSLLCGITPLACAAGRAAWVPRLSVSKSSSRPKRGGGRAAGYTQSRRRGAIGATRSRCCSVCENPFAWFLAASEFIKSIKYVKFGEAS
jgi:hypothetical protein